MTSTEIGKTYWLQRGNSAYDAIAAAIGEEVRDASQNRRDTRRATQLPVLYRYSIRVPV